MHKYGPTFLTTHVALKEDLNKLICCTSKLPAVSEVIDGAVMQLTEPQKGYVTGHFYKVVDSTWVDITDQCGPVDRQDKSSCTLNLAYEIFLSTVEAWATGYLDVWWDEVTDSVEAGALLYEVVVRKPYVVDATTGQVNYPSNPTDGEVIVRKGKGVAWEDAEGVMHASYTSSHPYRFDDVTYGTEMQDKYCYRLFHVYASGWWSYTNCTTRAIPTKIS